MTLDFWFGYEVAFITTPVLGYGIFYTSVVGGKALEEHGRAEWGPAVDLLVLVTWTGLCLLSVPFVFSTALPPSGNMASSCCP